MRIKALKDFTTGPNPKHVVIRKGDIREIQVSPEGEFWTYTNESHAFGQCKLSRGWEVIQDNE